MNPPQIDKKYKSSDRINNKIKRFFDKKKKKLKGQLSYSIILGVKGSSSVFQGSNAIGGIVNIITGKETNHIRFQGNTNSALGTNLQLYKLGVNGNLNLKKGEGQRSNTDFEHYSLALNWNDLNFIVSYKDLGVPGVLPDSGVIPIFGD